MFAAANCGYSGAHLNANLYRPYQGWGSIAPMVMGANSNYNSLQVSMRATAWKNLTLNTSYTWSHAFDIIDGEIFSNVSNPFNARWDYGPAGFDRRQIWLTSFIYQIPFFRNSANRAEKALLGGWEFSGIYTLESGTPFSIGGGPDNLGYGGGTSNRADIVAASHLSEDPLPVVQHLVVHAAGSAAMGHFGEERRGRAGTQQLEHGDVQSVPIQ